MTTLAQSAQTSPLAFDDLGAVTLSHLEAEERLLQTAVDVLRQTRSALISGNLQRLAHSLERQVELERASAAMARKRVQFQTKLGASVTLSSRPSPLDILADQLAGAARSMLQQARVRIIRLAATASELNRGNAILLRSNLDLLEQVLSALTGGDGGGKRYGRAGAYQAVGYGSLLSARG